MIPDQSVSDEINALYAFKSGLSVSTVVANKSLEFFARRVALFIAWEQPLNIRFWQNLSDLEIVLVFTPTKNFQDTTKQPRPLLVIKVRQRED